MGGRIAFVLAAALGAAAVARTAHRASAQPAGGGDGSDIEMEPEGSAGSAAAPDAGSAAPGAKDPKVAKKWLAAARELVTKGNYFASRGKPDDAKSQWENAVTAFDKSLEANADLGVQYELALVEEKLGKFDDAVRHLRPVVAAKGGVRADVAKKATAKLDDLSSKVGVLTLTVEPEGAAIVLNGAELGKAPLAAPLVLMPGTYTFSFTADGFQPKDAEVKIEAGAESERAVSLDGVPIIVETPKPAVYVAPPPPVDSKPSRAPIYVGGAVTVIGVGAAAVFGVMAVSQHETFVAADTKPLDRQDARDNGKLLAHLSDAGLAVGVAGAAFTAYWLIFHRHSKSAKSDDTRHPPPVDETSKLDVAPWVQSNTGGISVFGAF